MCDALTANRDVKKPSKRCKTFVMAETSNTSRIRVVCAIYDIQLAPMNYVLLGNATETVSQIKVCVIYGIRFTWMNCFRLGKRTEMVQLNKMCVICSIQFT